MFKYNTYLCIYLHTCTHLPHESTVCVLKPFSITAIAQERQQSVHSYISLYRCRFFHFHCCFDQGFGKMLS